VGSAPRKTPARRRSMCMPAASRRPYVGGPRLGRRGGAFKQGVAHNLLLGSGGPVARERGMAHTFFLRRPARTAWPSAAVCSRQSVDHSARQRLWLLGLPPGSPATGAERGPHFASTGRRGNSVTMGRRFGLAGALARTRCYFAKYRSDFCRFPNGSAPGARISAGFRRVVKEHFR